MTTNVLAGNNASSQPALREVRLLAVKVISASITIIAIGIPLTHCTPVQCKYAPGNDDKVLLLSTLLCFLSLLQFIAMLFAVGGIVLFAYEDSFGSAGWLGVLLY